MLEAASGGLQLALALAVYPGMRGGDIVRVTWWIYDGKTLEWRQGKEGDPVWLPAVPELRGILDKAERIAPTIVTSSYGRPLTEAGLRKAFRSLMLRLERDRKIAPGLTLHGRRHTLGDSLANLGADPRMIQAVVGQRSMAASLHYSAGADRRRAASAALSCWKIDGDSEQREYGFGKNSGFAKNAVGRLPKTTVISMRKSTAPGGARGLQTRWRAPRRLR